METPRKSAILSPRLRKMQMKASLRLSSRNLHLNGPAGLTSPMRSPKAFDRRSESFNSFVRSKFISTAKKYLGVPYRKSYLQPDDPNYNAPLFLDCCGLVRQVCRDLQKYLGFRIGNWNQCYQFDLLPKSINFEDMKPGDLIFYEGKYIDKATPRKFHDMTHVEIYLGKETGEASIGSRSSVGFVTQNESYKFESKKWTLVKYHYKSIDTWIHGICRSFCPAHPWRMMKRKIVKKVKQEEYQSTSTDSTEKPKKVLTPPVRLPPIRAKK